jgi:hypothetical protein
VVGLARIRHRPTTRTSPSQGVGAIADRKAGRVRLRLAKISSITFSISVPNTTVRPCAALPPWALNQAMPTSAALGAGASLNLCDQRIIDSTLPAMKDKRFIAKRCVANHPWRFAERPVGDYCEEYWTRWQAMGLNNRGLEWGEISLRLALFVDGVSSAIGGTASAAHLQHSLAWAAKGPLDEEWVPELRGANARHPGVHQYGYDGHDFPTLK